MFNLCSFHFDVNTESLSQKKKKIRAKKSALGELRGDSAPQPRPRTGIGNVFNTLAATTPCAQKRAAVTGPRMDSTEPPGS
jgi:hypothetical protein